MKQTTSIRKWSAALSAACALALFTAPQAQAAGTGQLGILDTSGINPFTNAEWQVGDSYRLTFLSSDTVAPNMSTDIADWNSHVQGLADTAGLGSVTWNVLGSTADMDARDNTSTNVDVDGAGHAIMLIDGTTAIANDFADLWDGEIQNTISLSETGGTPGSGWPMTGTYLDGTKSSDHGTSFDPLGGATVGQGNSGSTSDWVWRTWTGTSSASSVYAMSEELQVVPESSAALLIGLAGLGFIARRRR